MQDATVRKMYRQARRVLGATSAIRVALGSGQRRDIPKSDERIDTVGITNCCELYVVIQQQPDIFKVTVKYPGSIGTKVIDIAEVSTHRDCELHGCYIVGIMHMNVVVTIYRIDQLLSCIGR